MISAKKSFRNILCIMLCLCTLFGCIGRVSVAEAAFNKNTANAVANETTLSNIKAKAYAALHTDAGRVVIAGETAYDHYTVGNMIKLMTLYLTFDAIKSGKTQLLSEVKVSKEAQKISEGRERVFLDAGKGEVITVEQAVIGICVGSANDCAYALAEHISGGTEADFVVLMNNAAKAMGLNDTCFTDSTGIQIITDGQYSCAADMCVLSYQLVSNFPEVLEYTKITSGVFEHTSTGQPDTNMQSSNALISTGMMSTVDGLLVGYSKADLYAQAATADIDGERVYAVVIGEETAERRAGELKALLNLTASNFETKKLDDGGVYVRTVNIKNGKSLKARTCTSSDFYCFMSSIEEYTLEKKIELNGDIEAPVSKGDIVGKVIYSKVTDVLDDEGNPTGEKETTELGYVDLIIDEDIDKAGWFTLLIRKILAFFGISDY